MTKKLISFLIALCIFIAIPLSARYKYNPFTRKLDYYETGADIDLGDLADVTLTGLATGNILYYNGTAWVNLATGANTNVLTLAAGIPSWAAPGAPAAHAATHLAAGADSVDHDLLLNYFIYNHVGEDHLVDHNIWIGWQAGQDLAIGGQYNTLVGEQAGTDITTGDYNTIIGFQAGFIETTGFNSTFVGYQAGMNLGITNDNTAVGYKAMWGIAPTGYGQNVAIGSEAFTNIGEESLRNTVVGVQALSTASDEAENITAIGYRAAANLVSPASNSVLIGSFTGNGAGATYEYNVIIGVDSGGGVTSGSWNTIIGNSAASSLTTGRDNVLIGHNVSDENESGAYNVVVGSLAGKGVGGNSFNYNVILGYQAAEDITTGSSNVVIGYMAGETNLTTGSNQLWIDNSNTATPLIYGNFSTDSIKINGEHWITGYHRSDYILWVDCFDHGSTAAKYGQDWDITALNTQGAGSNTIQTNPGNITLTTDNNAVGDNEGTRTDYQMVDRASQARTDFGIKLGQTANTQFYCGWNTSGTNAMVAAADEYVIVFFDVSDNANWQIKVGDGATEDVFTSGVAGAVGYVRHEIWVEADGTVHWIVNGTELDITGSVDNLMTASDHYLIVGQAQSVTGAAVIVAEIGYVEHEKLKDH